jgi:hypothetical protein
MIKPAQMLMSLSQDEALGQIAKEVEEKITRMIDDAQ